MTDQDPAEEKSIVGELNFGAKTAKRATWEAWEFAVVGPHQIEVTNAAYGFEKDDHSYIVGIEERDGLLIPAECGCKADKYREDYDCKHKVALASVGGPVVLQAAVDLPAPTEEDHAEAPTLEDKLRADGGAVAEETEDDTQPLYASEQEECEECSNLSDLPCWPCYREGKSSP